MKRGVQGFGLIESMLSLALFALLLAVIADLVTGYQQMVRHGEAKDRELKAARISLDRIRSDLRAAAVVETASGSTLRLQRLPLELSPRLPAVVPESPPTAWNILDPAYLTAIVYGQSEKNLICEVAGTRFVVAEEIEEFEASTLSPGRYQVVLKLFQRAREVRLVTRVTRL